MALKVHNANIGEREGARLLLADVKTKLPRVELVWADGGYNGEPFAKWVKERLDWKVSIVKPPSQWMWMHSDQEPPPLEKGFKVLPRRWVVERTFG